MVATTDDTFEGFFERHYAGICRALWLGLGNDCNPEDAAQEAFARAFQKWPAVSRLDRPATWVFVVAVREARHQKRRRDRTSPVSASWPGLPNLTAGVASKTYVTHDGGSPSRRAA